jgi:hypothetical protein
MIRINKIKSGSVVALLCIGLFATVLSSNATTPALAAKPPRTPTPTAIPPATPSPTSTPTAPPDFALGTNRLSPWWTGYLSGPKNLDRFLVKLRGYLLQLGQPPGSLKLSRSQIP